MISDAERTYFSFQLHWGASGITVGGHAPPSISEEALGANHVFCPPPPTPTFYSRPSRLGRGHLPE